MRYIFLISLIYYSLSFSYAQKYNFQCYSIEEGLPRSSVYDIYEDTNGFLWIGTEEGGLSVFDGINFHNYTTEDGLVSNTIRCIYEDSKHFLWIGTDKGVSFYDGKKFTNYTEKNGFPKVHIRSIQEDKEENLFFGTLGNGLYKLKNQITDSSNCFDVINTDNGLINDRIRDLLLDSRGALWVGTDGGISKINGKLIQNYTEKDGLPSKRILSMFEDKNHNVWFGTNEGVVELKGDSFITYNESHGLISNRVRSISQDHIGNMWFGTNKGASYFDGTKFKNITDTNGLSHNRIRVIKQDRNHNLWFGTYFGGINKYIGETFISYTTLDGLKTNEVYAITGKNNELVISTFQELSQFTLNLTSLNPKKNTVIDNIAERIRTLRYDKNGLLWIGSQVGIHIIKDSIEVANFNFEKTQINSFYEISDTMLITTSKGIYKIFYNIESSKIDSINYFFKTNNVNCILPIENNHYLIGTQEHGLLKINHKGDVIKHYLPKIYKINSLVKDHFNNIWIASEDAGLICLKKNGSFEIFTNAKEFSSKHAHLLIFDNHDDLWVGYENGVDKIEFDNKGKIKHIYHFGKDEGFSGIETNKNAVYKDFLGKIWFGTIKGAICFNPHAEHLNKIPPITHLLALKITGQDSINEFHKFQYNQEKFQEIPENIKLDYHLNNITFTVKGINLSVPHKVKYQWKLEGFDSDWNEPSTQSIINYTNLPYGKYTFLVKSCNENDIWNTTPTSFKFEITSPFWKKNWFYISFSIIIFIVIYLLFFWRVKRLERIKQELENKVNIRTQELVKEKELVEIKNQEIENKRNELETKNTAITDSINYAKRIQQAVMSPKEGLIFSLQKNMFILYKPRDIVSGDFYWFSEKENRAYIVAADCTGHGVPGAFMSMLGITFLNQLVNEEHTENAGKILNNLRKKILSTLSNAEQQNQSPDGMDLALLIFDFNKNEVQFSGANNPLIYIHNNEISRIKGNKMPIGLSDYMEMSFTTHTFPFHKGDVFYIFSDGYADQFGGDHGKKFLTKSFKELLLEIHSQPLDEQKTILEDTIEDWKGDHFQVDDILVIGIKI